MYLFPEENRNDLFIDDKNSSNRSASSPFGEGTDKIYATQVLLELRSCRLCSFFTKLFVYAMLIFAAIVVKIVSVIVCHFLLLVCLPVDTSSPCVLVEILKMDTISWRG